MDDKQLALILTAMADQTAALNRMADAMAGILTHLDPRQAGKLEGPNIQRPLSAYATFNWPSIGASMISWDKHGATEVEYNGATFRRYRSNDDDPKGVDIRFRRVVSGTPEAKNMVWATLIKFADKKAKEAPRPLRGELAEKIEQAAADQATRINPPAPAPAQVQAPAPAATTSKPSGIEDKSAAWTNAGIQPLAGAPAAPPPHAERYAEQIAEAQRGIKKLDTEGATMTVLAAIRANHRAVALATGVGLPPEFIEGHTSPKSEMSSKEAQAHTRTLLEAVVSGTVPATV